MVSPRLRLRRAVQLCPDLIAGCEDLTQRAQRFAEGSSTLRFSAISLRLCVKNGFASVAAPPGCTAMPRFDRRLQRLNAEAQRAQRFAEGSSSLRFSAISLRLCVRNGFASVAAPPRCTAMPRFDRRLQRFNAEAQRAQRAQRFAEGSSSLRFSAISLRLCVENGFASVAAPPRCVSAV